MFLLNAIAGVTTAMIKTSLNFSVLVIEFSGAGICALFFVSVHTNSRLVTTILSPASYQAQLEVILESAELIRTSERGHIAYTLSAMP